MSDPPPPRRRWRRVLAWTAAAGVALAAALVGIFAFLYVRADVSTAGELDFAEPLRIPELDEGVVGPDGVRRFQLDVQAGTSEFRSGVSTETWGVNGPYLGPTLRADRGDEVEIAVTNGIAEVTSMHWHGMHLPASMDGGPHQPIEPGDTWRPTWTVDQPAATLWYHPHPHGETAEHVYRGVAGMFLLDDDASAALHLPHDYGVDDLPLIIQDRSFDGDGQFEMRTPFLSGVGVLGDEILINGTLDPHVDVHDERVRLRLLNGSNARFFDIGFVDGRPFQLIGTDGGLLPEPVDLERIPLSPGERAEVVVTFEPGERVVLRSFPPDIGGGPFDRFNGGDDTFDLLELRAAATLRPSAAVPDELVPIERIDEGEAVRTREWRLSGRTINGEKMDMERIDAVVGAGSVEIWDVRNNDGTHHNFHVHDVQFQVLDVGGDPPPARLQGGKDTVGLPAGSRMRLIVRFGDHVDPDVPYMFHCHVLDHEDRGMMGQFVVVEPGRSAGTVDHVAHVDHLAH